MGLKSQVELIPPRPGSWAGSGADSTPQSSKAPPQYDLRNETVPHSNDDMLSCPLCVSLDGTTQTQTFNNTVYQKKVYLFSYKLLDRCFYNNDAHLYSILYKRY